MTVVETMILSIPVPGPVGDGDWRITILEARTGQAWLMAAHPNFPPRAYDFASHEWKEMKSK